MINASRNKGKSKGSNFFAEKVDGADTFIDLRKFTYTETIVTASAKRLYRSNRLEELVPWI